ncbi:MAG: hypothetical protein ACOWWO_16720 [Peptococcaceae bacterium]
MTPVSKTLHAKPEPDLAALQVDQEGNSCSFHAIVNGLRLLLGVALDPMEISDEVDRIWKQFRLMRTIPGWAVTPRQQVRIIRHVARTRELAVTTSYQHGDPETLPSLLADTGAVPIITLVWLPKKAPPIYYGDTNRNFNATQSMGGHTMVVGAYDTAHTSGELDTPWGFINPWKDNATQLFWMTDADFRKAWGLCIPLVGPNPLVVMRKL